jgi:hypothetical protein
VSASDSVRGLGLLANEPAAWVPPTWALVAAVVFFAGAGCLFVLLGRYWAKRHRQGTGPASKGVWSGSYTVPHHSEDGIFFGSIFLGLAAIAVGGIVARLLGLW